MKLRPSFPEIPADNPFANCKLEREPFAKILTSVIDCAEGGFTMALNGSWGTGKTTFVRMWQKYLEKAGYKTAYINAWEMDFTTNPLVSILGEVGSLTGKDRRAFKKIIKALPKSVRLGAEGFISTYTGQGAIKNLFNRHTSFDEDITTYCDQKEALLQFRSELQSFIEANCVGKPLVFFIDELDRCRPDYAVEFLERIKHFFCVDNIIFIVSVDKKHLAESVKGHYGSADIDTDEYLRRFFDIEYDLPCPELKAFCEYIFKRENLDGVQTDKEKDILLDIILMLVQSENITLRQVERYISQLKLCYASYRELLVWHDLAAFLIFHKYFNPEIYDNLKASRYDVNSLSKLLSDKYGSWLRKEAHKGPYKMSYLVINLLYRYNKQLGIDGIPYLGDYRRLDKLPVLNFEPDKVEHTYAYNLIRDLEKINDGIALSDLYHLIDISLPFTKDDLPEARAIQ